MDSPSTAAAYTSIEAYSEGPIGFIKLNRPRVLNALDGKLMEEGTQALAQHVRDEAVRVIVLYGEGETFSSGFDLKEAAQVNNKTTLQWRAAVEAAFEFIIQFWHCEKPTIAAIQGYCLAGALELALCCDITVADDTTFIGEPEVKFGAGIVALVLPWFTGPKVAKEFLLTGHDRIPARRAYELGLINDVVPRGQQLVRSVEIARKIAKCSPDAVRMTKRAVNRSLDIAGMAAALRSGVDTSIFIEGTESAEKLMFNTLTREKGLKAAITWRDNQFGD
jgi:enoyl-CoA hydratase